MGVFQGGEATNVITPEVNLRAEARSHSAEMRTRIVSEIRQAFERAAAEVTNHEGAAGSVEFSSNVDYESFALAQDHPSIAAASDAVRACGGREGCQLMWKADAQKQRESLRVGRNGRGCKAETRNNGAKAREHEANGLSTGPVRQGAPR